jgi:hypothetical protein
VSDRPIPHLEKYRCKGDSAEADVVAGDLLTQANTLWTCLRSSKHLHVKGIAEAVNAAGWDGTQVIRVIKTQEDGPWKVQLFFLSV